MNSKITIKQSRLLLIAALLFCIAGIATKALMALNTPVNPDSAIPAVLYFDLMETHSLSGWFLVKNSYLFSDFPVYLAVGVIFGMGPKALGMSALIVLIIVCALGYQIIKQAADSMAAAVFASLVLCSGAFASWLMLQPFRHIGTIGMGFAGFLILGRIIFNIRPEDRRKRAAYAASLLMLCIAGTISDMMFLLMFPIPAALAYATGAIAFRQRHLGAKEEALIALCIISGSMLGMSYTNLTYLIGLNTDGTMLTITFIIPRLIFHKIEFFLGSSFALLGTALLRPFEHPLILALSALISVAASISAFTLPFILRDARARLVALYFLFIAVGVSAAFILVNVGDEIDAAKYMTALVPCQAAFIALAWHKARHIRILHVATVALLAMFMASGLATNYNYAMESFDQRVPELSGVLDHMGPSYGYAEQSLANPITATTSNRVKARPVELDRGTGKITPLHQLSNKRWYDPELRTGETFYILQLNDKEAEPLMVGQYGNVTRRIETKSHVILFWPYNIMAANKG